MTRARRLRGAQKPVAAYSHFRVLHVFPFHSRLSFPLSQGSDTSAVERSKRFGRGCRGHALWRGCDGVGMVKGPDGSTRHVFAGATIAPLWCNSCVSSRTDGQMRRKETFNLGGKFAENVLYTNELTFKKRRRSNQSIKNKVLLLYITNAETERILSRQRRWERTHD